MTTYEQKYGRLPDGLVDLETPPEDWQFENPIATGKITGRKPMEVRKLDLSYILPKPKEVVDVKFRGLPEDKQIKIVADEYNGEQAIPTIIGKLGISRHRFNELRDMAKAQGLITEFRKPGKRVESQEPKKTVQVEVVTKESIQEPVVAKSATAEVVSSKNPPTTTAEDFAKAAGEKLELAATLAKDAERLQLAGKIALAIEELLGSGAEPVIAALYAEVAV